MFSSPLHPLLVHLPLVLAVLSPFLAVGMLVAWIRGWLPRQSWLVVVVTLGVLFGGAYAAQWAGEQEEERVEEVVPERAIEAHERWAGRFLWAAGITAGVSVLALVVPGEAVRRAIGALTVVGAGVTLGLALQTGKAGGDLVYRHGAASVYVESPGQGGADARSGSQSTPERLEHEEHD